MLVQEEVTTHVRGSSSVAAAALVSACSTVHTPAMKISDMLRRVLQRNTGPSGPPRRSAAERQGVETAEAWKRPGGPVDAGFSS